MGRPWRFFKAKKEHTDRGTVKAAFGEDNAGVAYGGLHTVSHKGGRKSVIKSP